MSTSQALTPTQVRFFEEFGYLPVGRVSTSTEVAVLKGEFARLAGTDGAGEPAAPPDHLM